MSVACLWSDSNGHDKKGALYHMKDVLQSILLPEDRQRPFRMSNVIIDATPK